MNIARAVRPLFFVGRNFHISNHLRSKKFIILSTAIYYAESHEWIKVNGKKGRVGISDFAQEKLGDVVYVELPELNATLKQKETSAAIESVKAASDIYSPVSGVVTAVNEALTENASEINKSPESDGWLYEMDINDDKELESLMNAEDYNKFIENS